MFDNAVGLSYRITLGLGLVPPKRGLGSRPGPGGQREKSRSLLLAKILNFFKKNDE